MVVHLYHSIDAIPTMIVPLTLVQEAAPFSHYRDLASFSSEIGDIA